MTTDLTFPLFHERTETSEGANTTDLSLTILADGAARIEGCHSGPAAERFWGDWDHEFWLDVPPGHLPALLASVLRDGLTRDGRLTYTRLRDLLKSDGIPFEEGSWT